MCSRRRRGPPPPPSPCRTSPRPNIPSIQPVRRTLNNPRTPTTHFLLRIPDFLRHIEPGPGGGLIALSCPVQPRKRRGLAEIVRRFALHRLVGHASDIVPSGARRVGRHGQCGTRRLHKQRFLGQRALVRLVAPGPGGGAAQELPVTAGEAGGEDLIVQG